MINGELELFYKTNNRIDTCMNFTRPQLAIEIQPINKAFIDAKSRGVQLRYLTEITKDDMSSLICARVPTDTGIMYNFLTHLLYIFKFNILK